MRIAVASSNGEDLDLHFGKAHSLYVYEYHEEKDEFEFIDKRTVEIESYTKHQNPKIIDAIKDCEVAICQQFGVKAQMHAGDFGLKLVKDEGTVEEALRNYIDHVNFMKNIKI
ncbi:Predicted Fe-Mo cluster-binding protein, NifX family [Methanobrevibacter olleyae]|uniref:Predicted Fe-Mo cluster-binding protein, NifX family n=1 Tax=Methanobrevibacter olleyae TaxID=294671 RepID=A0A1I4HIV9_METOL|nr:NifB/NifX family molybdenum-iron cluster-binding protein [Methanobrevibacter olleyae]SFL41633.1 Predicted Fe-Mo cluster-binding protein, NifX family [Methanobrevibacter olleyae]